MQTDGDDDPGNESQEAATNGEDGEANAAEADAGALKATSHDLGAEISNGAAEVQANAPSAEKLKAIEELRAAIRAAAAKPKMKKRETEELLVFCSCVRQLADDSEVFAGLKEALPRIGEQHLVPLMGIKRPAPKKPVEEKPSTAASAATAQRVLGRVKSYNTRKGFGFIMVPGFARDIFVYNSHLIGRIGLLAGEAVVFDLVVEGGRPQARNVKVTEGEVEPDQGVLTEVKKAMAEQTMPKMPLPGQSMSRDMTLALAAAAAEVPTTLPQR